MKSRRIKFLVAALVLLSQPLFAEDRAPGSSLQAYKLAKEKKWNDANVEAKRATESQPNDAEAWFILGLTEERLEHLGPAIKAYEKYLALSPSPAAAQSVQAKLPDLKNRRRQQNEDIYGRTSNGFFIEKSLSYNPSFVDEVHGEMATPFGLGFHFGKVFVGYRKATGSFSENIRAPNASWTNTVYTTISGGGKITHQEVYANIEFSLVEPYTSWGNMQLALPFVAGGFVNTLEANATGKRYGNVGYDLGLGLALRGFTRSPFTWYVQGIYHLGIPFWGIREAGRDKGIRNASGEDVKGNITGFETTAGISLLFGSETNKHY